MSDFDMVFNESLSKGWKKEYMVTEYPDRVIHTWYKHQRVITIDFASDDSSVNRAVLLTYPGNKSVVWDDESDRLDKTLRLFDYL